MTIKPIIPAWKGTMTSMERFIKQMHYEPIDRTVNMEFGYWDECFEQWVIIIDNNVKNHEDGHRLFNLDKIDVL